MISVNQVLAIHLMAIEQFGGADGVRDLGGLEAALARPFQTFGGEDLYPTFIEKAAAIAESIIINHPFIDGNKRTGYILMEAILLAGGIRIALTDMEIYPFVIAVSTGQEKYDDIVAWLKANTAPI
jgi:death on curing protein